MSEALTGWSLSRVKTLFHYKIHKYFPKKDLLVIFLFTMIFCFSVL